MRFTVVDEGVLGSQTLRIGPLVDHYPEPSDELHPRLAAPLGIMHGDWATAVSRRGSCTLRAQAAPTIRPADNCERAGTAAVTFKEATRMEQRIDYKKVAPDAVKAMYHLQAYVNQCGLEAGLLELVKLRASQINGCAYCIDMHTKEARAAGETEQRLYLLTAWREAPFYTERERAALAWTEAVTLVSEDNVPDEVYEPARSHFSEKELADLTLAVITINAWNRLAISFRSEVGNYQPGSR